MTSEYDEAPGNVYAEETLKYLTCLQTAFNAKKALEEYAQGKEVKKNLTKGGKRFYANPGPKLEMD